MNLLHPLSMFSCQGNPLLFDDAEMLQTDVMRFFSILCLCLMAIFALVKTLPMAPPEAGPAIAVPADRNAEVKKLQEKIAVLKAKLERNHSQKRQSPQKAAESQPMTSTARQGFTLRFASDEVLNKLISAGKVKFYAIAGNNAWRLRLSGARPVYTTAKSPQQVYVMEAPTVPSGYAEVFQRQIAAFGRHNVTWGVTLPGPTAGSIRQLIRDREGGELIITADGGVNLN